MDKKEIESLSDAELKDRLYFNPHYYAEHRTELLAELQQRRDNRENRNIFYQKVAIAIAALAVIIGAMTLYKVW